jgi:hypothetical protein
MVFTGRRRQACRCPVRHRQDGDALVDQFEHVGGAGLAADGALLGLAVVDAAGFVGEALAHVFRLAGGGAQRVDEARGDGLGVGGGSVGAEWEDVCT